MTDSDDTIKIRKDTPAKLRRDVTLKLRSDVAAALPGDDTAKIRREEPTTSDAQSTRDDEDVFAEQGTESTADGPVQDESPFGVPAV